LSPLYFPPFTYCSCKGTAIISLTPQAPYVDCESRPEAETFPAAGAPENKIEITPAMIEAGADIIWRGVGDIISYGSDLGRELASAVFEAMSLAAQGETKVITRNHEGFRP
jgi:hypothetical protein